MINVLQKNGEIIRKMIILAMANASGISDNLKGAIITALVTGIISVIGFVVTNISMRKNFANELFRQRDTIALEKMSTMPFEVLELLDRMMKAKRNERDQKAAFDGIEKILNVIYSYGSEKAISLVALMQKENYATKGDVSKLNRFRFMSSYVLLATQIKYDVTGVCINPELWLEMRIIDYEKNKIDFKRAINKLVDELDLSDKMKIV